MFSEEQIKKLSSKLPSSAVSTRKGNGGLTLSYVDGWHIVETANAVFGFDGWSSETLHMEAIHEPALIEYDYKDPKTGEIVTKKSVVASYSARVRVTVYAGDRTIIREGSGGHRTFAMTVGEACENAIKGAESDALKRAMRTFGSLFGLALYDKEHRNVGDDPSTPQPKALPPPSPINIGFETKPKVEQRAKAKFAAAGMPL